MTWYKRSSTGLIFRVQLSNSSTGAPLTGLTSTSTDLRIGTIASNEAATTAYTSAGSTIETITTLGTYAAPTAGKCRFKEVDSVSHPGLYELQFADARFSIANSLFLDICISGASLLLACPLRVLLRGSDPNDAASLGLSRVDETISSRFATSGYTAPNNAGITSILSDTNALVVGVNVSKVATSTQAATMLGSVVMCNAKFTVGSGSTVTSIVTSSCTPQPGDLGQFTGQIIAFDQATTTVALRGKKALITNSTNATPPTLTIQAGDLITAPASGDTGTIV